MDDIITRIGGGKIPVQVLQKWVPATYGFANPEKYLVPMENLGSDKGSTHLDSDLKAAIKAFLGSDLSRFNYEVDLRSVGFPGQQKYYLKIIFAENETPVTRGGIGIFGNQQVTAPLSRQVLGVSGFNFTLGMLGHGGMPIRIVPTPLERRRHALAAFNRTMKENMAAAAAAAPTKSKTRSRSKSGSGSK